MKIKEYFFFSIRMT